MNLPPQAYFEITRACNQACPFCSCPWECIALANSATLLADARCGTNGIAPDNSATPLSPEMSIDEWKSAADELIANGVCYIAVTGGEPTLKPGAQELFRHIAETLDRHHPGKRVLALFTNGKNVSRDWLDLLKSCRAELYTSLPGLQTFSAQTGEPSNGYRRVMQFIYAASEMGIPVSVGVTVTKNMLSELYEICSYAVLSGAKTVMLNLFKPSGRGASHPEFLLNDEDILFTAKTADEVASKCGSAYHFCGEFPPIVRAEDFPHLKIENRCVAAKGTFTVAPDGTIHVCEHDARALCRWQDWRSLAENALWSSYAHGEHHVCPFCPESKPQ